MTCIITWAGVGDLHARTIPEMVVLVFLAVCTKFISATFVGDISAIVQSYSHALVNYDHGIVKLKVSIIHIKTMFVVCNQLLFRHF